MVKKETDPLQTLPGSWDLVKPSIRLLKANIDTLLWLVVLPAALALLASQLLANILRKYSDQLSNNPSDKELSNILHRIGHELLHTSHGHLALLLLAAGALWQLLIYPATISFMLRAAKGQPADIKSSLKGGFSYFWRTFGITICVGLTVMLGLLLFIVPGFIFARRYLLATFYGMDRKVGVFEAMRLSAADSKPYKSYVWGTIGVFVALGIIGSVVGTIPVLGVVVALVVNYLFYFGFALRYQSIVTASGKSAAHASASSKKQ